MYNSENSHYMPFNRREPLRLRSRSSATVPPPSWESPTQHLWSLTQGRKPRSPEFPVTRTTEKTEWFNPAPPTPFERHEVELRHRVAAQLRRANTQHLFTAMEKARAGEQTLAAHGLSLFYAGSDPSDPLGFRIYTVSRWGYSGPEYDDLSQMLQGLDEAARKFIAAAAADDRQWDPRGPEYPLVNVGDFPMPAASTHYVGIGIETLDTDQHRWTDIVDQLMQMDPTAATRALRDVPCEAAALLVDGSQLSVVHDNNKPMGYNGVRSNRTLQAGLSHGLARPLHEGLGQTLQRAWPHFMTLSQTLQNCSTH